MFDGERAIDSAWIVAIQIQRHYFRSQCSARGIQRLLPLLIFIFTSIVLSSCSTDKSPGITGVGPDMTAEIVKEKAELEMLETETVAAAMTGDAGTAVSATAAAELEIAQATEQALAEEKAQQATEEAKETAAAKATTVARETTSVQATTDAAATIDFAIRATSTAIFQETKSAYDTAKMDLLLKAFEEEPFTDPISGTLALDDVDIHSSFQSGVDLQNFVVQSRFLCPGIDANCGRFGIVFRDNSGQAFQLTASWTGDWMLQFNSGDAKEEVLSGTIADIAEKEEIELSLYVEDTQGFFFLNDVFAADLDLGQLVSQGDVAVIIGYTEISAGVLTPLDFQDLVIWSLDPIPPTPVPVPTAAESAPPPAEDESSIPRPPEGLSRLVIINETVDRSVSVKLWTCCENILIDAPFAETVVKTLPEGEYGWEVSSGNCMRGLPQLFLRNEIDTVLFVIPQEGGCGFYLSLYTGEE